MEIMGKYGLHKTPVETGWIVVMTRRVSRYIKQPPIPQLAFVIQSIAIVERRCFP